MSAERLREAAALMRERAEAATAQSGPPEWTARVQVGGYAWIEPPHIGMHGYQSTAAHIASWHPAVALAVAMLLDNEANAMDGDAAHVEDLGFTPSYNEARRSLLTDIANAYLGDAS